MKFLSIKYVFFSLLFLPLVLSETYKCSWTKKIEKSNSNSTAANLSKDTEYMLNYLTHESGECNFLLFNEKTIIITLFDPKYRNQRFVKLKLFLSNQFNSDQTPVNQTVKLGIVLFEDSDITKQIDAFGHLQIRQGYAEIMMDENRISVQYHEEAYIGIIIGVLVISLLRVALSKIIGSNRPTPEKLSFITFHYYLSITASVAFMELIYGIANFGSIYSLILIAFAADLTSLLIMCKDFSRLFERARGNIDTITYYILVYGYNFSLSHSFYENWYILANSFFLLPQIIHNIRTGSRLGPNWAYICLLCLSHSYFIYIKLSPDNLARIKPQPLICLLSIAIVGIHVIVIVLQNMYGPIFILKSYFIKNYYKYEEQIEIGSDQNIIDDDCSICLYPLSEEPGQIKSDRLIEAESGGFPMQEHHRKKKTIMKTPCNHRFHVNCLLNWMDIKLECPIDRVALPPIY